MNEENKIIVPKKKMPSRKVGRKSYENEEERYKAFINNAKLSQTSKNILDEYIKERRANGFRDKNNVGIIGTIINIQEALNKCITQTTKEDLQNFFSHGNFKITTELWYKKILKRFYYWLHLAKDNPKYLLVISWIDTKQLSGKCSTQARKKREDKLLSPSDVRKLIEKAQFLRDKLAISLLADTGVRAETIGSDYSTNRSINLGQIEFHKGYAIIRNIEEKFSKRRDIIVTESLSYLIKYWNEHPKVKEFEDLKSKEANLSSEDKKKLEELSNFPLFIAYGKGSKGKRWGYSGLKYLIDNLSKEAIGRVVKPHDFRHLKATRLHLDEGLSDDSKCKLMGWSSRRMLDRYNHTSFNDAKDEYLAKKGIIKLQEGKRTVEASILKPKECLVCRNVNSSTDSLCENCGNSLNYENMIKKFTEREKAEEKLVGFMDNKPVQDLFKMVEMLKKQVEEIKGKN